MLDAAHEAESRLYSPSPVLAHAAADARAQFDALIYPRFVSETGLPRLPDLVRYVRAISRRLDTAAQDPARDADRAAAVARVTAPTPAPWPRCRPRGARMPASRRCAG